MSFATSEADAVLFREPRTFQIGERELVVRALAIADYHRAAATIGILTMRFIREHPEVDLQRLDEHLDVIFPFLLQVVPGFIDAFYGLEAAYLEEHCGLDVLSDIIATMIEQNQLPLIVKNARRALQSLKLSKTS